MLAVPVYIYQTLRRWMNISRTRICRASTIEIGTEDFLFQAADAFEKALTGAGVKHEYITRNGVHDWTFWKACTPKIIEKVGAAFE